MFAKIDENGFYEQSFMQYKKAPYINELDNILNKPFYWFISSKLGFKYMKQEDEQYMYDIGLMFGSMSRDADFFIYTGDNSGIHSYEDGGFHYVTYESIYGLLEGLQELEEKKNLKLRVDVQELWDAYKDVYRHKKETKTLK